MKKIIIFSFISAVAVYLPFVNVAQAISRPWCYLIPPFNDCSSNHNSSAGPVAIYRDPQPIIWPTPYPGPTPAPISYNGGSMNRPPAFEYTGNKTVYANHTLQFDVNATDVDSGYLYFDLLNTPSGAWFAPNSHTFYWTPAPSQVGSYTLNFSVSDGNSTVYQNVYVTVLDDGSGQPNNVPPTYVPPTSGGGYAPSWNQIGDKVATVGQFLQFTVYAYSQSGVSYTVLNLPSGARFDAYSQLFSWNPDISQLGDHIVTFRASNNYGVNDMVVRIHVVTASPVPAPVPPVVNPPVTPAPTPTPAPAPAPTEARIIFSNIKVENQNGDAVISWNTNIPATDRVIWDTASEGAQSSNFGYAHATTDNTNLATSHTVNLGKLDVGTTYYLRLVSKTSLQTRVSQEIAFVQVPQGQSQDLFGASLIGIFGKLFSNTGFLWILILGFGTTAVVFYRKHKKAGLTV